MQVEEGPVWPEASSSNLVWIDSFPMKADPNLYFEVIEDETIILLLYVDDLFFDRE